MKFLNSLVRKYPYPVAAAAIVGTIVIVQKAVEAVKEKMPAATK